MNGGGGGGDIISNWITLMVMDETGQILDKLECGGV